ncbi:MAG: Stp1/IreP family PP2C-type Ser/Thr phosphatase [Oligoflexia bacterium]|nr:Stp1/IreP family PP2C-type Ser/Thr phosphatase [Oligoflexia bacterium]MBF0366686.1 Stp1/IreP family PP2C-type Ser/Thr phosphatase [Oligoflexia bacterium]
MGILSIGKTDIGRVRKNNQDAIYLNHQVHLYLVADGMGGHSGGEIASSIAVESISKYFMSNVNKLAPEELLKNAIKFANQSIFQYSKNSPALRGMGTTACLLFFSGSNLYVANVGDSRAYLINRGYLYQLSKDHSLVQEKINLGIYTREEAAKDRQKNVLVRAVGHEERVEIDVFNYRVSRNDMFIICSDGLHGKVSDRDLLYLASKQIADPAVASKEQIEALALKLIEQANCNGGQDNISVIVSVAQ